MNVGSTTARSESTTAGLLGYLAAMIAVLALLSAPLVTVAALLTLGIGVGLLRRFRARPPTDFETDEPNTLPRETPSK